MYHGGNPPNGDLIHLRPLALAASKVFGFTAGERKAGKAPPIAECLANIECTVVDIVPKYDIVVLGVIAAHIDEPRKEKRTVHAVGNGTFIVDDCRPHRRKLMTSKIPNGGRRIPGEERTAR